MGHSPIKPDIPEVSPERLRAAVRLVLSETTRAPISSSSQVARVLSVRMPTSGRMRLGAEETVKEHPSDPEAADYFQALIELGYLVASADGLADPERDALADLLEFATGNVLGHQDLRRHFVVLDQACEALGRRQRIGRAASTFDDSSARQEALSFASLVAIADGHLGLREARALLELGERLAFTDEQVEEVLSDVVAAVRRALEG